MRRVRHPTVGGAWVGHPADAGLLFAGGIADVHGMAGALALGGDVACMGTRFIATPESGVVEQHRQMIAASPMDRIVISAAMNGVPANWIRDSLEAAGIDPANLPAHQTAMPEGVRPWRDLYSAGQSVELIDAVEPVAALVARLADEFASLTNLPDWRARLAIIADDWTRAR